jgi:broad specificity phosphatase PhoE
MPPTTLHLLRHGEVHNPDGVVYGSLPGFGLSERGIEQAGAAADHLAALDVSAIFTSPLDRARQTAAAVADRTGLVAAVDERLVEWELGTRWAGVSWDDLAVRFPGETDAYLAHPHDLSFAPESLSAVAGRMRRVVEDLADLPGAVVLVSHQDPIQALRLVMTGAPLSVLQSGKPGHGSVVTLRRDGSRWLEMGYWAPPQGPAFPPLPEQDGAVRGRR